MIRRSLLQNYPFAANPKQGSGAAVAGNYLWNNVKEKADPAGSVVGFFSLSAGESVGLLRIDDRT